MQLLLQLAFHPSVAALAAGANFFQSLWSSEMGTASGLVGPGSAIFMAAMGILSVVLIAGVYEVFVSGGDMLGLLVLMVKGAACGLLITEWSKFFTDVTTNGAFQLAQSINTSDFYSQIGSALKTQMTSLFGTMSFMEILKDVTVLMNAAACCFAFIIYYIAYWLMEFLFTAWGMILYALGPLLVAVIPSRFAGSFGKTYIKALVEWLSWPVLYALLAALIGSLQNNTDWATATAQTTTNNLQVEWVTIVYSIMLLLLPWMAHRILGGDFAGTVGQAAGMTIGAAKAAVTGGTGAALGALAGGSGMLNRGASGGGAAAGASRGGAGAGGGVSGGGSGGAGSYVGDNGGAVGPPSATPSGGSSSGGASGPGGSGSGGGSSSGGTGASAPAGGSGSSGGWKDRMAGAVLGARGGPMGVARDVASAHFRRGHASKSSPPPPSRQEA